MERPQVETIAITDLLEEKQGGMSIQEISRSLGINRITIGKYLHILQVQGRVDVKMVGTSKVYSLSDRIPGTPFITSCPCLCFLIDRESRVVNIQAGLLERLHRKREDIIGAPINEVHLLPAENALLKAAIRDAQRGKKASVELDDSGSPGHKFKVDCIPAVLESGKPGVLILLTASPGQADIGEHFQSLDTISRILGDDDRQYIIRFLPDGTITDVNEAYCRATGKYTDDLIGSRFRPMIPDEDLNHIFTRIRALSQDHDVEIIEYHAIMASGEPRWLRWRIRAFFDANGHISRFQGVGTDITEFKHAQENFRRSYEHLEELVESRTRELKGINKQLYQEIEERGRTERQLQITQFAVDNAGDLIIWLNKEGRIVGTNKKIADTLGYSQKAALSLSWQDIIGDSLGTDWQGIWNAAQATGHHHTETYLLCRDQTRLPVDIIVTYLNYGRGESCCCFIRDIRERIKNEDAIRNADQKVNFLNRITRVDIRNALFTLLGYLEVLRDPKGEGPGQEYIEKLLQSAEQIQARVNFADLFQDLGSKPPNWQDFGKTFLFAVSHASTRNLVYHQNTEDLMVFADPLLEKVIGILISSALHYSPGTTEVINRYETSPGGIDILLEFRGIGIPQDRKPFLFEMKGEESDNPGLFLCREILSLTGISLAETGDPATGITIVMHVPDGAYKQRVPVRPIA